MLSTTCPDREGSSPRAMVEEALRWPRNLVPLLKQFPHLRTDFVQSLSALLRLGQLLGGEQFANLQGNLQRLVHEGFSELADLLDQRGKVFGLHRTGGIEFLGQLLARSPELPPEGLELGAMARHNLSDLRLLSLREPRPLNELKEEHLVGWVPPSRAPASGRLAKGRGCPKAYRHDSQQDPRPMPRLMCSHNLLPMDPPSTRHRASMPLPARPARRRPPCPTPFPAR